MTLQDLPWVNACLNGLSGIFLVAGFVMIRQGNQRLHRNCMVAALSTSALFLTCYLIYHFQVPRQYFREPGWFRPIYLAILLTHTLLAMALMPMVLGTFFQAVRGRFERHRRWARWTWPVWMYVSVTGVVIYLVLYQVFPQSQAQ